MTRKKCKVIVYQGSESKIMCKSSTYPVRARCVWPILIEVSIDTTVRLVTVLYAVGERYGFSDLISCSALVERIDATSNSNHADGSRSLH